VLNKSRRPQKNETGVRKKLSKGLSADHRKLHSLLELGQLIGLDLQLDDMLFQIARKATEVMEADRFSIFLYDPHTDELYTTVALGMGREAIRVPADAGIAGHCFKTGDTVSLEDAHADPRFNLEAEARTGYRTRTLLSMPFYNRAGQPIGVTQLLNKKRGLFTDEDRTFLKMFNNHAAVFIEMAQLQKARLDALERSRQELDRLNRAKTKAINQIAHELKTPIALIQAYIRRLQRKLQTTPGYSEWGEPFEILERNLKRLSEIQTKTGQIFRVGRELEAGAVLAELELLWKRVEDFSDMPSAVRRHWNAVKVWMSQYLPGGPEHFRWIPLYPFLQRLVKKTRYLAAHRDIRFGFEGDRNARLFTNSGVLREVLQGLVRNAFENTPDGGAINVMLEAKKGKLYIQVVDCGIGIVEENKVSLFDGFSPAREIDLYTSKRPYDFGAGGKGLDLLRMKLYGERFGFELSMASTRCGFIPTDGDLCPGSILLCHRCKTIDDCFASGGSTFTIAFPVADEPAKPSRRRRTGVKP
jgi:signal transduction histidine kinase